MFLSFWQWFPHRSDQMGCLNTRRSFALAKTGSAEGGGGERSDGGALININSQCRRRDAPCFGPVADISYLSRIKLARRRLTVKVKSAVTGRRLVEAVRSNSIPAPRTVCLEKRWQLEWVWPSVGSKHWPRKKEKRPTTVGRAKIFTWAPVHSGFDMSKPREVSKKYKGFLFFLTNFKSLPPLDLLAQPAVGC